MKRGLILLALLLAGCAAPAPTAYYRLTALPGASVAVAPATIGVRSINIPGYLNQNNIARPAGPYQFASYPNDLWAEPLADMLQSVMAQDLAQRLPGATVLANGGGVEAPEAVLVEMNVQSFDPGPDGRVTLQAQVAIKTGVHRILCETRTLQASATPGPGATGIVAAMSQLWAGAADQVAALVADCATGAQSR
jgi:uncharacterized lipoprotein YmbA